MSGSRLFGCVRRAVRLSGVAGLVLAIGVGSGCSGPKGRAFDSPEEGASALVGALRPYNEAELREILGPEGTDIIASGDEVADREAARAFVESYARRHRVVVNEGEATLVVGDGEWPMPIPLVRSGGGWRFDAEAGEDEILARRIGRNELAAIETCRAVVDAQREYARLSEAGPGSGRAYAQKFASDPGTRDGLYWQTTDGEPPSPLGPLVAAAVAEGYGPRGSETGPRPFHGYYFRMLTAQGPSAPGGARSYLAEGRMPGGFGVVAWPVEYGNSGIMSFIVSDQGIVYQRDLGEETDRLVSEMAAFEPDKGWEVVP